MTRRTFRRHMSKLLKKRDHLSAVRLELDRRVSPDFAKKLAQLAGVEDRQVFADPCPLNMGYVFKLIGTLPREVSVSLLYPPYEGRWPEDLDRQKPIRAQVEQQDKLLFYPYDSVEPFLLLLSQAAEDPEVLSVKITIYRLASPSKVARILCRAAENGKDVLVLMELRARFDEAHNLAWAKQLEEAGCQVIYGMEGFKCHSKVCLITTRSRGKTGYLTQIGTGNYNEKTNAMYTDLCLMTADQAIGEDAAAFFRNMLVNDLEGKYRQLRVSPFGIREELCRRIDGQAALGREGYICIKANSVTHRAVIDRLCQGLSGGGGGAAHHPGHLLHPARGAGVHGQHPHHQRGGPLFRARPGLCLWPGGGGGGVSVLRRPDDPEPGPPGGDRLSRPRPPAEAAAAVDAGKPAAGQREGQRPAARRDLCPAARRCPSTARTISWSSPPTRRPSPSRRKKVWGERGGAAAPVFPRAAQKIPASFRQKQRTISPGWNFRSNKRGECTVSRRGYAAAVAALVLSLSLTACGTAANSGDPTASRTGTGNSGPDQRSARSAYDYLEDGHYSAARTGKIRDQAGRAERDFTQDVRDMLGDTEKAAKDIGQDVKDAGQDVKNAGEKAAGDVTNAAKEAKNGVENTVRDATGYR